MKIEIWCEGTSIHGEHLTEVVAVRVPSDIKVIDSKACVELLRRRRQRIHEANRYRVEYNSRFKDQVERDAFGKKNLVEKLYTIHIKGWSPIITTDALEFICQRL
jgi:hypothetical protein